MRIMGVDPGVTTGVAVIDTNRSKQLVYKNQLFKLLHEQDAYEEFVAALEKYQPDFVVIEDFVGGGPRTPPMVYTMNLVGFVQGVLKVLGFHYKAMPPMHRRAFLPDAKELIKEKGQPHATDALAHALAYSYREELRKNVKKGNDVVRSDKDASRSGKPGNGSGKPKSVRISSSPSAGGSPKAGPASGARAVRRR